MYQFHVHECPWYTSYTCVYIFSYYVCIFICIDRCMYVYILWYINYICVCDTYVYIYIHICDICAKPTGIKRTHYPGMRLWTFRTATLPRAPVKQHHWHHPGPTSWTNGNNPFMVNHEKKNDWNFTIWKMFDCLKCLTLFTMMIFFVN